jgi:cold shock protein
METGIVKFFSSQKGYGFIAIEGSEKDIFLHKTGIPLGVTINNGDKVAFDIIQGPKGPNAIITRVLDGVSAR